MDTKINSRLFAKIHLDKLLSEDRKDELISIVSHYFSSKPYVMAKLLARYEAEIKTKTKKQAKGKKQNEKAKENDNIVSINTDDSTD
jgi:hypothetical protein